MVKRTVHGPGTKAFRTILCACVMAAFVLTGINAFALSGEIAGGKIDLDTTLKYGIGWRVEDQKTEVGSGDILDVEGNHNFDKGDLITNTVSIGMDADVQWEHFGVFVRGRGFYDPVYDDDDTYPKDT